LHRGAIPPRIKLPRIDEKQQKNEECLMRNVAVIGSEAINRDTALRSDGFGRSGFRSEVMCREDGRAITKATGKESETVLEGKRKHKRKENTQETGQLRVSEPRANSDGPHGTERAGKKNRIAKEVKEKDKYWNTKGNEAERVKKVQDRERES
jgi:hypothetical protein